MVEELEVPEGVKEFNFWTILLMARLWDQFPRPQWFYSRANVVLVTGDPSAAGTELGPHGQVQRFADTLLWLMDEGFVRGTADAAGGFRAASLTTRGFSVLNQVPNLLASDSITPSKKSLGDLIREAAVQQSAGNAVTILIQNLLGQ